MTEKIGLKTLFVDILVGIICFSIPISAYCLSPQARFELLKKEGESNKRMSAAAEKEVPKKEEKIHSEAPVYNEAEFSSIVGEFFVNPQYTGRITTVRTFPKGGSPRDNPV